MKGAVNMTLEDIHVSIHAGVAIGWNFEGARYHVWVDRHTLKLNDPKGPLYKNPLRGIEPRSPGYFDTRKLNPIKPRNMKMIATARDYAIEHKLLDKALAEEAEKERARDIENKARSKRMSIRKAGLKTHAALIKLKGTIPEDVIALYPEISDAIKEANAALDAAENPFRISSTEQFQWDDP
jgi:hypothetical protein